MIYLNFKMFVHSNYVQNCRSEHSGVFLVLVTLSNFILVFSLKTGKIYLFWSWSWSGKERYIYSGPGPGPL